MFCSSRLTFMQSLHWLCSPSEVRLYRSKQLAFFVSPHLLHFFLSTVGDGTFCSADRLHDLHWLSNLSVVCLFL